MELRSIIKTKSNYEDKVKIGLMLFGFILFVLGLILLARLIFF